MAAGLSTADVSTTLPPPRAKGSAPAESVWQAPLFPIALAATAGIVLDRYTRVPPAVSLVLTVAGLIAWAATLFGRPSGLSLLYLWLAVTAFAAAYHYWHRDSYPPDDIGEFASADPVPAQLRGYLEQEPTIVWQPPPSPLKSLPRTDKSLPGTEPTLAVLRVTEMRRADDWLPVSGRARLVVTGHLQGLHAGDEVEAVGRLVAPHGPGNPGEADQASQLRDQRVRAQLIVAKTPEGVTRLARGWNWSLTGWLAVLRGWGQRTLQDYLPPEQSGVATALLLGEGSTMTSEDWEKYIRSGVIHVLVIAGQHLVVLAIFLWWMLRLFRVRRHQGAVFVGLFLLAYALLTGFRPPAMRAAVTMGAFCGGLVLRRQTMPVNSFALAWLVVVACNPAYVFDPGCQMSFLSVAVLYWGGRRWFPTAREPGGAPTSSIWQNYSPLSWFSGTDDPLERLLEESRPTWLRLLRRLARWIIRAYTFTVVMWLVLAPLVAARYHLISPVAVLIGPFVLCLGSLALVAGFLLLSAAVVAAPLAMPFAWVTRWSLAGCEFFVRSGLRMPGAYWYVDSIPDWWLWVFYGGLLGFLMSPSLQRWRHWALSAGLGWLCVGLLACTVRFPSDELRCTFLAVGHGGCTVLETPDGRTLLYDAGAMAGPDVTRHQIAPYLWSRGIRRIDEVLLSHADLDHFNGLIQLLERFPVGQVTCTPTFADKQIAGVPQTLNALEERQVPVRIARAGDRLTAGELEINVLHPPANGPDGNENARSMVLLVRHAHHTILLTGDLEGPGLARVLALRQPPVDVLQAPHHGSRVSNIPELARWARPRLVVSCEGPPRGPSRPPEPYSALGATFLGTWPHGAVTIHSHATGLVAETFQTRQRFVVLRGSGRQFP